MSSIVIQMGSWFPKQWHFVSWITSCFWKDLSGWCAPRVCTRMCSVLGTCMCSVAYNYYMWCLSYLWTDMCWRVMHVMYVSCYGVGVVGHVVWFSYAWFLCCIGCVSLSLFRYFLVMVLTITNSWRRFAIPLLLFIGAKMNAIFFYHYMEFSSVVPPENLVAYFAVEGPYILSMLMVVLKVFNSLHEVDSAGVTKNKQKDV